MCTLYVDKTNLEVRLDGNALAFYEDNSRTATVPIAPIERVVFKTNVTLQTSVLSKLGERRIGAIFLNGRKHEPTLLLPSAHNDARRRISQYALCLDPHLRHEFATEFIREKLFAQINLLRNPDKLLAHDNVALLNNCLNELQQQLNSVPAIRDSSQLFGLEGHCARIYFRALTGFFDKELGFRCRNRNPPEDPVNALLSLSYTLLYADTTLALHQAGLDPFIGFLHKTDFGRHSLSCDVMEAFRPIVDKFVIKIFADELLTTSHFNTSSYGCRLSKDARAIFYPAYEHAAQTWRPLLEKRSLQLASRFVNLAQQSLKDLENN